MTRPANTVGGDFYDIQPLRDGRVVIALGDVSGKGSPAALLMALLLAMFRTLVPSIEDENLEAADLAARLNVQVSRHAPGNRFITLFCGIFTPLTGELRYVSAGHTLAGAAGERQHRSTRRRRRARDVHAVDLRDGRAL
jgi:serine phosphatase RsbU (regulator of sigma subunit)